MSNPLDRDLMSSDPAVAGFISQEWKRQVDGVELIASENYVSIAVLEAVGSVLTNKYAEGYPGARYYGGCVFHDEIERLAISRAKALFGCDHANVQPHSGASANLEAYDVLLEHGQTVLAMRLDHGGHLTHGAPINFSGKFYKIVPYGVQADTGLIDYDEVQALALEHKPAVIVAGASAYARQIDFARFGQIAKACGAKLMVDMAHIAGLVAAKLHPSPIEYADIVTTTTHKTLRGPRGGMILCKEALRKPINSRVFPGFQGGPLMHVIAGKAVCLKEALEPEFVDYQKQVLANAKALAGALTDLGYNLVSGGTDNHLVLVDLRGGDLSGAEAEAALSKVDIIVNKNKVPFDPAPAQVTSGMRLGTPAITSRGLREVQVREIAQLIHDTLLNRTDDSRLAGIKEQVRDLMHQFPLYEPLRKQYEHWA